MRARHKLGHQSDSRVPLGPTHARNSHVRCCLATPPHKKEVHKMRCWWEMNPLRIANTLLGTNCLELVWTHSCRDEKAISGRARSVVHHESERLRVLNYKTKNKSGRYMIFSTYSIFSDAWSVGKAVWPSVAHVRPQRR